MVVRSFDTVDFKAGAISYQGGNYLRGNLVTPTGGLKLYLAFRIRGSGGGGTRVSDASSEPMHSAAAAAAAAASAAVRENQAVQPIVVDDHATVVPQRSAQDFRAEQEARLRQAQLDHQQRLFAEQRQRQENRRQRRTAAIGAFASIVATLAEKEAREQSEPEEPEHTFYNIRITNSCDRTISIWLGYKPGDGSSWQNVGPFEFAVGESAFLAGGGARFETNNSVLYWYAVSDDGQLEWKGPYKETYDGTTYMMREFKTTPDASRNLNLEIVQ